MENKYKAICNLNYDTYIGIIDIEYGIDDYCINEVVYKGVPTKRNVKNKIYTDRNGRTYIVKCGCKTYLDDFIRTDI